MGLISHISSLLRYFKFFAFLVIKKRRKMMSSQATHDMKEKLNRNRSLEMLKSGEASDFVIEVQENDGQNKTDFNVHKFVLIANSDVFQAMFSHKNTVESRESRIQIKDSTGTAVRQMLYYIYTGDLPTEYNIETDAIPLMYIANKYQIKPLMDFIEKKLIESLTLENVFNRLELAELYQIDLLKSACCQLMRNKFELVKGIDKWADMKENFPKLAISILEGLVDECAKKHRNQPSLSASSSEYGFGYNNNNSYGTAFWIISN